MVNVTATDIDVGVTLYQSGNSSNFTTTTTAIDVTHTPATVLHIARIRVTLWPYLVASYFSSSTDIDIGATTHSAQLTTAVNACLDFSVCQRNPRTVSNISSQLISIGNWSRYRDIICCTSTAAIDVTIGVYHVRSTCTNNLSTDGTASDDQLSTDIDIIVLAILRGVAALHGTILATTIDITLDGTASDCQLGTLDITQLKPVNALSFH